LLSTFVLNLTMKRIPLIILALLFKLGSVTLQAQVFKIGMGSIGLYNQYNLSAVSQNKNTLGPQLSFNHYKFATNVGLLLNDEQKVAATTLNADFHIWKWHHAYLVNRFVPYVGIQLQNTNVSADVKEFSIYPRIGIKGSLDRFIFECGYLNNGKSQLLQAAISYVLWIGSNCSMKRVKEFNKYNILEF